MKRLYVYSLLFSLVFLFNGCKKEKSFENGLGVSAGSLQDSGTGDCLPSNVAGAYVVATVLDPTTNWIEVTVDVTTIGSYTIYTDTVNGYFFRAAGQFTTAGLNTVQLKGKGTPLAAGTDHFIVTYGNSGCAIAVNVSGSLAEFTLDGSPNGCTGATPAGTYTVGIDLTSANSVNININVTTLGAYSISTAVANGMVFSGSGVLTTLGPQSIVLTGAGNPGTAGVTDIPITAGSTSCTFPVTVQPAATAAVFTFDCAATTVNGTYTVGTPLAAGNTISVVVNITTPGTYTIAGNVGGMTFTGSGTFAATGTETITLAGTGTPTTAGANTISLTGATTPCDKAITVNPAAGGPAVFTLACPAATVNGTYTVGSALVAGTHTISITANVTSPGPYSITGTVGGMTFTASGNFPSAGSVPITLAGTGTPTTSGANSLPLSGAATVCNVTINVVAPPAAPDYFPRTLNSNWSYEFNDIGTDSVFMKVIGPTHTALGNTYNVFMASGDGVNFDTSGYFRKSGNDYYRYTNLYDYLSMDDDQRVEFIFLKDNQPVNTTWTTTGYSGSIFGTPLTIRIKFTILQKDVSKTVVSSLGSVNYANVIAVKESYEFEAAPNNWVSLDDFFGYYVDYYARDKGWILDEWYDNVDPQPQDVMECRRLMIY